MRNIFVLALVCCLSACYKTIDTPKSTSTDIILAYPTGYIFNSLFSGLNYFDFANLNLSLSAQIDTVLFSANIPDTANAGATVTVGVNASLVAAYNGLSQQVDTPHQVYVLMPSTCYTLVNTSGVITSSGGQAEVVFKIAFYPANFDPTVSYMLPISITNVSPSLPINQNMETIYFHQMSQ